MIVFSQCISVELSVTWDAGNDIFKKDSMVFIPKLHITYRNMSNTNQYFLKLSNSRDELPNIGCGISIHPSFSNFEEHIRWRTDYLARAKEYLNYANQNFHVPIGGIMSWDVMSDFAYFSEFLNGKEMESDVINCCLENIYEYMYRDKNSKDEIAKTYFSPSDIIPENILSTIKNQFVFLKPNEIYVDTYNLVGFKLVEGCFTFLINQDRFYNYVLNEPIWDNDKSCWIEQKTELPAKVGEYQLYDGPFLTNSLTVDFSGR